MQAFFLVVKSYQHIGLIAFVATVFLTPVAMRLAWRYGVLDMPDKQLKPHARPTPYLGGTAIAVAWALALLAGCLGAFWGAAPAVPGELLREDLREGAEVVLQAPRWRVMLPLLLGGLAMSVLGLVDDVRQVPPKVRLLVGAIVITSAIVLSGAGFTLVSSLLSGFHAVTGVQPVEIPEAVAVPVSVVIGVIIVLGACNSTNLIDGLDGLCSGVTSIISLGFFLLAGHMAATKVAYGLAETGDPERLALALAMFGAALGFLPWNFNPARIFMGDAGSMLLGYNCGMLILLFSEWSAFRWTLGALMIFALPVFDTSLAMYRRWRAGRSLFEGDRSHFYDQLVQRGLSVRQTVLVSYALTIAYGLIGLLMTWVREGPKGPTEPGVPVIRTRYALLIYLGVVLFTALAAWAAGLTDPERPKAAVGGSSKAD